MIRSRTRSIPLAIAVLLVAVSCGQDGTANPETQNNPPDDPSNPRPLNGAANQSIQTDLSWTGGDPDGDPVTYDVHFGSSPSPPLVSSDQCSTAYDPGTLIHNTEYHWCIVAEDNHGSQAEGDMWGFTTAEGPKIDWEPQGLVIVYHYSGGILTGYTARPRFRSYGGSGTLQATITIPDDQTTRQFQIEGGGTHYRLVIRVSAASSAHGYETILVESPQADSDWQSGVSGVRSYSIQSVTLEED